MVRIRLARYGKKNSPHFRIGVFDGRTRRDGTYLENLGTYNPVTKDNAKKIVLNRERYQHWIRNGALPTLKLERILKNAGQL